MSALNQVISTEEAAKLLGLSGARVRVFCAEGRLKARKIGKGWALLASDVRAFAKKERRAGRRPR